MTTDRPDRTLLGLKAAQAKAREEATAAHTVLNEFPKHMRRIATRESARQSRKWGIITLAFSLLLSFLAGGLAVNTRVSTSTDIATLRLAEQQRQQQVDDALTKLGEANRVLEARGQPPVSAPPDPSASDAITAAVTARVIATLPKTPTAEQVASTIVGAVTASLVGPTQNQLASLVASYYQAHPPEPGPPPSEAAIRAAVDASLAANPPAAGPKGDKGDPCLPSEPACRGDTGPVGATGAVGPAGRGIVTGPQPVRTDDGCVWRTTFTDGTTEDHPASPLACPLGN